MSWSPIHRLSRACPSRLELRERFITRHAISLPQANFPHNRYQRAASVSLPIEGKCFAAVRTPDTDAATTSRSQLAKNKCLPGDVSKIRERVLCLCRWVHRLRSWRSGFWSGRSCRKRDGHGPCHREIAIVLQDSASSDALFNIEAGVAFTAVAICDFPCC